MSSKKIYQDVFSQIYENYGFGGTESRSGFGSTLSETKELREKIKVLIQDHTEKPST